MSAQPTANQRLARQKKAQAYLSAGTATLGVAALGSKGLAVAAPKASKFASLGRAGRLKPLAQKVGNSGAKFDRAANNFSIGSAGVGGASGFNFASVQAKESKKIKKSQETSMDFGLSTVRQGRPLEVVEKSALTPEQKSRAKANAKARGTKAGAYDNLRAAGKPMGKVKKAFDSERSRLRRLEVGSGAAAAGAGALGLASAQQGVKSINGLRGAKTLPKFKAGLKSGGRAGALGAGAIGAGYAADRINSFRKGKGASYR